MTSKNSSLRQAYLKLLNSTIGQTLEPKAFLQSFCDSQLIDSEERQAVDNEKLLTNRQSLLFLRILPSKGSNAFDRCITFLKQSGCSEAADLLLSENRLKPVQAFAEYERQESLERVSLQHVSFYRMVPVSGFFPEVAAPAPAPVPQPVVWPTPAIGQHVTVDQQTLDALRDSTKVYQINYEGMTDRSTNFIGQGGFANVYLMRYKRQVVAVKEFLEISTSSSPPKNQTSSNHNQFSLTMLYEEMNIMKGLNHPNVIQFIGYVHDDKRLCLVTEYIKGGSLARFCFPHQYDDGLKRRLSHEEKLKIAVCCWDGLDYLHNRYLFHKDIHPGNILVSDDLRSVKISDFGLSEFKWVSEMYETDHIVGNFMYFPPELASKQGLMMHPKLSDVYAMGVTLCELFSERHFWHHANGESYAYEQVIYILSQQINNEQPPSCWPDIRPDMQNVLYRAVTVDLQQRYTADKMLALFKGLL